MIYNIFFVVSPGIVKIKKGCLQSPFICVTEKIDRIQYWIVPQVMQAFHRPPKSRWQIEFECRNLKIFYFQAQRIEYGSTAISDLSYRMTNKPYGPWIIRYDSWRLRIAASPYETAYLNCYTQNILHSASKSRKPNKSNSFQKNTVKLYDNGIAIDILNKSTRNFGIWTWQLESNDSSRTSIGIFEIFK